MRTKHLTLRAASCLLLLFTLAIFASGCLPEVPTAVPSVLTPSVVPTATLPLPTPMPTRPSYQPGQLVDYKAQMGDTLDALAARFNTSVQEIRAANPIIPDSATTMPTGMPMKIPIYYRPLWGSQYQILPDSLFVDGPAARDFDAVAFVDSQPGWLKFHSEWIGDQNRRGGEIINFIALNYSISPRLLLALAEYQTGALSNPSPPDAEDVYLLGYNDHMTQGFYPQMAWAADLLDQAYYDYRLGKLLTFDHLDGRIERPDPWQNAATVALQYYYSRVMDGDMYTRAISSAGLAQAYRKLFGDPWNNVQPHIPGSLVQPELNLPFEPNLNWAFTGGPHNPWGEEPAPLAALDFAPPSIASGCVSNNQWVTAMADGVITRTGTGIAVLDLDGDMDERTGWDIFYLHLETTSIPPVGTRLKAGEHIGHPSCEGGHATGTHVHIARKFNGEWMLADGPLAYNLEGWISQSGASPYDGTLSRGGRTVTACTCSDSGSQLESSGKAKAGP